MVEGEGEKRPQAKRLNGGLPFILVFSLFAGLGVELVREELHRKADIL